MIQFRSIIPNTGADKGVARWSAVNQFSRGGDRFDPSFRKADKVGFMKVDEIRQGQLSVPYYGLRGTIRYDTIAEINVDSKAEYTA